MLDLLQNIKLSTPKIEVRLRNDIYQHAQKQHLAANLFSLDEIAVVPKVLTPLIQSTQPLELAPTDSVSLSVPYIPDWPELAAIYKASTMTILEALQGGANIILAGHPGSGKTVALAWLASALARNQTGLGTLEGLLPLYANAHAIHHFLHYKEEDFQVQEPPGGEKSKPAGHKNKEPVTNDAVDVLIKSISSYASAMTQPRLPGIVRNAMDRQRAILLLDGVDELPPTQAALITRYIQALLEKYPRLRIVVSLSYEDLAGLPALGFSLLGIAAWSDYDRSVFLSNWSRMWEKWIYPHEKDRSKRININYLNSWIKVNSSLLTPLEFVLKVWAAYSGDVRGSDGPSLIETHIKRMTSALPNARDDLERLAVQLLLEGLPPRNNEEHKAIDKQPDGTVPENIDKETSAEPAPQPIQVKRSSIKPPDGAETLIENGFLVVYSGSLYKFAHPVFAGYLAGNGLGKSDLSRQVLKLSPGIGKTLALNYLAYCGDISSYINPLIQDDDILHTNHLLIARWLQYAPKNRPWRSIVLKTLASILQKEKDTLSLSAKIISGMAFSGDAGVSYYFRQLIKSDHPNLKQLAALGCGVISDKKAVPDLNEMLQEQSPASIRSASLALAAIGDKQSLELLASGLLNGNEMLRRCAAEALANDPIEGHPALKDGSEMEDLMVRRAVAFGLMRVNLPWATKIVETMQLEDSEWVVRNAAIQAFDELKRKNSYAPKPAPDLTEAQWLTDYAARMGTTVAPGKPAEALVVKALANGKPEEILSALDYLRFKCDAGKMEKIYSAYINNTAEIKDLAYYVLWSMMIAGIKLPVSVKYNIQ